MRVFIYMKYFTLHNTQTRQEMHFAATWHWTGHIEDYVNETITPFFYQKDLVLQ